MSGYEVTVPDMMRAREARFQVQCALRARYPGAAVVCLTMNVAGPVKTTPEIERAFDWGVRAVRAALGGHALCFEAQVRERTGPEAAFAVRGDARELKRRLCQLEDGCDLGRLLDIDVIAPEGEKLARTELGLPRQRCLLCGEAVPVCASSRVHMVDTLFARTLLMHFVAYDQAPAKSLIFCYLS